MRWVLWFTLPPVVREQALRVPGPGVAGPPASGIRPFPAAALDKLTRDGASMRFGANVTPMPATADTGGYLVVPAGARRHAPRRACEHCVSGHTFVDIGSSAAEVRVDDAPATRGARPGRRFVLEPPPTPSTRGTPPARAATATRSRPSRRTRSSSSARPRRSGGRATPSSGTRANDFATGNTWHYEVVARRCDEVSAGVVAFDEVLTARTSAVRSTGVVVGGKLAQYNLLPVPNELILGVVEKIRQTIELLRVDASIVVVNKPRDLLSVPGRHPDAPAPTKKRKRAGEYWEEALARARDEAPAAGSLTGRKLLNGVGSLASIPRREDKFRAHVQRAKGRVGAVDDVAVGALWRGGSTTRPRRWRRPTMMKRRRTRWTSRVLPWATGTCGPCIVLIRD